MDANCLCVDCGKSYKNPNSLRVHQKTHTGLRPFTCDVCNKSFGRKDVLGEHLRAHKNQANYVCQQCEEPSKSKQEQKSDTQEGKRDIQPLKTHYKTFTKTSLPHVLTEYGLEDKDHPQKKKEEKKKKKKRRDTFFDGNDDERSQRKAREEKFRQNYGDNRQTDPYYAEYLEFIEKKVIAQRQKLQKEREEEEKRAKEKDEEERRRRVLHKRRESIPLKHDDKYLHELPKTDLFRIVELQDKMKREGKLRNQSEVDKFWDEITQPEVFYAQFKVKRSGEPIKRPSRTEDFSQITSKSSQAVPLADIPPRSLSHISETSRDEQSWAITQQYQSTHGARTPSAGKPRKASTQVAKDAALDLERRCPKLEMPPMACFSLQLGEKPPDPEEIKRKIELKAREKNRKKFQRKLRKMHQLAMANAAAANRILAQRGDLTQILEGASLRDIMAVFDGPESDVRYPAEMTEALEIYPGAESRSSTLSYSRPSSEKSTGSHRLSPLGSEHSSKSGSQKSDMSRRKKKLSAEKIEYPTPLPLTYKQVVGASKVMEAKCMSTNWTNYMQAGKSVFAPT